MPFQEMNAIPNKARGLMVKTAIAEEALIRNEIEVFEDLYSSKLFEF